MELTRLIAEADGVGKILGNGQDYAAKYFQKGDDYKTTIGGVEAGLHDHRNGVQLGYARIYQYDPAPGRHTKGGILNCDWNAEDRGEQDLEVHAQSTYDNCVGFCMFAGFTGMERYSVMNHIVGEEISHEEWLNFTKRIFILRQAFNLREGINAHVDHKIPKKLTQVFKEGPNTGIETHSEEMGRKFYVTLGLDPDTGMPTKELLDQIGGLELVAEQLGL